MKIICTQENLKNGLLISGRIISPSNTLPILNNILLKTESGQLKISSTNLEIAITTHIRCKIEEEGEVTVLAKTFMELVNNLPNTNLILETAGQEIKIETENYHTSLKTLPAEEFPLIPQIETLEKVELPAQVLKNALNQVVFAASSNQTQPEISGVLLGVGIGLKLVATDRYRLAEKKIDLENKPNFEKQVILPQKTTIEVGRIIGGQTENLEILFSQNQVGFVLGTTQIVSRIIDGQYPDYQEIIPKNFGSIVEIGQKAMTSALKTGGIFSQNNSSVAFHFDPDKNVVKMISESSSVGKSEVEIPAQISGPNQQLLLNYHYVLDCLNSINAETVILKVIDDNSPALIVPKEDFSYTYLVMPIKN